MSWVRLDDGFADHPKILRLGAEALALWVAGLAYCNRQKQRDGVIPFEKVAMLYPVTDPEAARSKLEANGLWLRTKDGFACHDYHDYQPTDAQRHLRAAAGKRGGIRSGQSRREAKAKQMLRAERAFASNPVPVPVPIPDPERSESLLSIAAIPPVARTPTGRHKKSPKIPWPDDFVLTSTLAAYAKRQGLDAQYQWGKFQAHALRDDVRHANWTRAWEYWVRNAWEMDSRRRG